MQPQFCLILGQSLSGPASHWSGVVGEGPRKVEPQERPRVPELRTPTCSDRACHPPAARCPLPEEAPSVLLL